MARYTDSKAKINRAVGMVVYENTGATKAFERRDAPPGMHQRRGKSSLYGAALMEKKKIKHWYGVLERQLRRFFALACRQPENTGTALLILCERRLDNAIRRAGFTATRPQARQGISHGHFLVNGKKVTIPSYLVNANDVIAVNPRANVQAIYRPIEGHGNADWVAKDQNSLQATVSRLPDVPDISLNVDVNKVIELLSRS